MLEFLTPFEFAGRKFDRGSILFEFDALREPEATRFPQIGAYLRSKGIEFNEVPTPQMLYRGALWPDLYIANRLEGVPLEMECAHPPRCFTPKDKREWAGDFPLDNASRLHHGTDFHDTFIETFCRKITGLPSASISAKYHRSIWLPLYWPQTLRARKSIATPFHYPMEGYAGAVGRLLPGEVSLQAPVLPRNDHTGERRQQPSDYDAVDIRLSYVVAAPRATPFSVAFIVDDSPIYRVTDQDVCSGRDPEFHRFVVEYRGECNVAQELERLGLTYHPRHMAFDSVRLTLPTLANVAAGWRPRPTINDNLMELMRAENIAL